MGNEFKGRSEHSAECFGETRDHWWHRDFLRLMAKRWKLEAVRDVLDVGCGVGHWGVLLASVMSGDVRVTGVEREPSWVEQARARAATLGLAGRFSYRLGEAERLPFPDDSFDLDDLPDGADPPADPAAAIAEMRRVTRPGGLVAVAEPNNLAESLLLDSVSNQAGVDAIVDLVRFQLTCERGKVALGEGDNSLAIACPGCSSRRGSGRSRPSQRPGDRGLSALFRAPQQAFAEESGPPGAAATGSGARPTRGATSLAAAARTGDFAAQYARALASRERIVRGLDDATYHGIPAARSTWCPDERAAVARRRSGLRRQLLLVVHLARQRERHGTGRGSAARTPRRAGQLITSHVNRHKLSLSLRVNAMLNQATMLMNSWTMSRPNRTTRCGISRNRRSPTDVRSRCSGSSGSSIRAGYGPSPNGGYSSRRKHAYAITRVRQPR